MDTQHFLTPCHLFYQLRGTWHIQRSLGCTGTMKGIAHFRYWAQNIWHYQEQGTTTLVGHQYGLKAYREYAYVYDRATIAVYFWHQGPTKLLHTLKSTQNPMQQALWKAKGTHLCGADVYKAYYNFLTAQHFELIYQVQGPQKHYTIKTHFKKIPQTRT